MGEILLSHLIQPATMEKLDPPVADAKQSLPTVDEADLVDAPINASGHVQELERNFGIISLCSLAITSGNTWIALGGALVHFFHAAFVLGLTRGI